MSRMNRDGSRWWIAVSLVLGLCGLVMAEEADMAMEHGERWALNSEGRRPEPIVAVTNVCAWPNLVALPNGDMVAFIYNQPVHGRLPGDVECWASTDGGATWTLRSVAVPRGAPEQNRQHKAAGLTAEGDLIVVSTGYSSPGDTNAWGCVGQLLPAWVCTSSDGGRTWSIDRDSFPKGPDGRVMIPFGRIMTGADGKLRVPVYSGHYNPERDGELPPPAAADELSILARNGQNWLVRGDGRTWDPPVPVSKRALKEISSRCNETAPLYLGDGKWLAAARYKGSALFIEHSEDDGRTWARYDQPRAGAVSWKNGRVPGHLLRLADGTILLSRGNRGSRPKSVEVLFSNDEGKTWSEPFRVAECPGRPDCGYPSSVQRSDGLVVTAYYEGIKETDDYSKSRDYRMCVVIWDPARTLRGKAADGHWSGGDR